MKILVAGMGNVLRADDGFGVRVAQVLAQQSLPGGTRVAEVGISGLALVHEIMDGCDACIIVDATRRGGTPGMLYVLKPSEVKTLANAKEIDPHAVEPGRALLLAQAWGARPEQVYVIGCEPAETEELTDKLTSPVERAIGPAIEAVLRLVAELDNASH